MEIEEITAEEILQEYQAIDTEMPQDEGENLLKVDEKEGEQNGLEAKATF